MKIVNQTFGGERPLFRSRGITAENCVFTDGPMPMDGESPLKESEDISLSRCTFGWKYPLWYCNRVTAENCRFTAGARAGIWYTDDITLKHTAIDAPKTLRRASRVVLEDVEFTDAAETLWDCRDVTLRDCRVRGDYFAKDLAGGTIDGLDLKGQYCFDGARDLVVRRAKLDTKDAFWNCENIRVEDSVILGEYLGWNSKRLTFINCTIESLQGLCYVEDLVMRGCKVKGELLFEYSTLDAEIDGTLESIFDPAGGRIVARGVEKTIFQVSDPSKTHISCKNG